MKFSLLAFLLVFISSVGFGQSPLTGSIIDFPEFKTKNYKDEAAGYNRTCFTDDQAFYQVEYQYSGKATCNLLKFDSTLNITWRSPFPEGNVINGDLFLSDRGIVAFSNQHKKDEIFINIWDSRGELTQRKALLNMENVEFFDTDLEANCAYSTSFSEPLKKINQLKNSGLISCNIQKYNLDGSLRSFKVDFPSQRIKIIDHFVHNGRADFVLLVFNAAGIPQNLAVLSKDLESDRQFYNVFEGLTLDQLNSITVTSIYFGSSCVAFVSETSNGKRDIKQVHLSDLQRNYNSTISLADMDASPIVKFSERGNLVCGMGNIYDQKDRNGFFVFSYDLDNKRSILKKVEDTYFPYYPSDLCLFKNGNIALVFEHHYHPVPGDPNYKEKKVKKIESENSSVGRGHLNEVPSSVGPLKVWFLNSKLDTISNRIVDAGNAYTHAMKSIPYYGAYILEGSDDIQFIYSTTHSLRSKSKDDNSGRSGILSDKYDSFGRPVFSKKELLRDGKNQFTLLPRLTKPNKNGNVLLFYKVSDTFSASTYQLNIARAIIH